MAVCTLHGNMNAVVAAAYLGIMVVNQASSQPVHCLETCMQYLATTVSYCCKRPTALAQKHLSEKKTKQLTVFKFFSTFLQICFFKNIKERQGAYTIYYFTTVLQYISLLPLFYLLHQFITFKCRFEICTLNGNQKVLLKFGALVVFTCEM